MSSLIQYKLLRRYWITVCLLLGLFAISLQVGAQERPPRPISVRTLQGLNFGALIQNGNAGEVIISPEGSRSSNGSILLPNISSNYFNPARFEIDAEPGTLIYIGESTTTLTGSHGGTLILELGKSDRGNPFIIPYMTAGEWFPVSVGGILKVGPLSGNPAGSYSGTFTVTFIQQ